jgi:DNA-binding NtrC family response regulator
LGYDVETAESGERAVYQFKKNPGISFVLSDYKMPGMDGFDVLKEIKKQSPETPVVLMTGFGSIHHAVEAMQNGADDYLAKPFSVTDLEKIIDKRMFAVPSIKHETRSTDGVSDHPRIITQSSYVHTLLIKAERAAKSSAPILIEGPSGTGKELFARQIHLWSARRDRPWVAVNCAALPGGLLESELFGYEKGAFTGAEESRPGRFELADQGTLFLDEIGNLSMSVQAKLLRVLQDPSFVRLGGRKQVRVNVRVIAATNKDLEGASRQGEFREDLYHRIKVFTIELVPLRNRMDDIPILIDYYLKKYTKEMNTAMKKMNPAVTELFNRYRWPGNIREFSNALRSAVVLADDEITPEHLPTSIRYANDVEVSPSVPAADSALRDVVKKVEKEHILATLKKTNWSRTDAAKILGIDYKTLYNKMKEHGISEE